MNFLFQYKSYIFIGILIISMVFLSFNLKLTKQELETTKNNLNLALEANNENLKKLKEINKIHKAQLQAISNANNEKEQIREKVKYVKEYIYKSNENNLTKLFNDVIDRLWEHNATSGNKN
ncbi:hypothetical protein JG677_01730 [Campylobacter sp. TTU-622]|uniref:hypothetical protein n=1 Tax=unclassified Campylobacter TaxID=2593542 RepID=UPI0019036095|nr:MULTISPECIES: hypothetical protein [unclassified Campylobacter]MBK1971737.1 hypothetical protein [Campylobacter sp. TTU_617]MBK1972788.1 hypothetical protein [Campylobacter sp. TTU-622]